MSSINESEIRIQGESGEVKVYQASPSSPKAGVIVVHEIWGLEDHIRDVARRFAKEGYLAVAPNLYSKEGELLNPKNIESAMSLVWSVPPERRRDPNMVQEILGKANETQRKVVETLVVNRSSLEERMVKDLARIYDHLHREVKKVGSVGFCMGGGLVFQLATEVPIDATAVFYGANPRPVEKVENIKGKVMGLYAGEDLYINSGLPELMSAVVKYKKDFELKLYPGAVHAFFNDTRPTYNEAAARDAWERTLRLFRGALA
ncbi:carboxymethylenebutenolidase [Sulfodiicoccus acidiphilus]|uniref:Carboxymethylenebutenolidase n=1 Tax=Sulfodiicoccus acidiphilus TaxID=1670455 RepID=A0A348B6P2_9CREN|nr:dienelactone hydrolase family protein [Sulfodiicoccus acidiphilus]BBD73844.1 carboxymethylenebutenolidase [Sulfodiicoccus acidiphilus]GGT96367.1 carboxymethylenebutenolidase [Sulfodiicoccus acidiphilus]